MNLKKLRNILTSLYRKGSSNHSQHFFFIFWLMSFNCLNEPGRLSASQILFKCSFAKDNKQTKYISIETHSFAYINMPLNIKAPKIQQKRLAIATHCVYISQTKTHTKWILRVPLFCADVVDVVVEL